MKIKYPDYNNSILNIANSVLKHFGAQYTHNTLPELEKALDRNYKNVVVMVFDAMGSFNMNSSKRTYAVRTFMAWLEPSF